MNFKRVAAFLAALLMTASIFASCSGDTSTDSKQTDANTDNVTTSADATTSEASDEVSDDLGEYNFNGDELHFYTRTRPIFRGEINVAEETGDQLDDAIYNRNRSIEERFNFVLVETTNESVTDPARTAVLAGDDTYDVINTQCVHAYNYAAEGFVIPVQDIEAIDLTKPYWNELLTNEMSVLGEKYFAVGDFNLTAYDFIHILLFNKKMADSYDIGDLYETVKSGDWTFDKYEEYGVLVTADVNGDGIMNESDRYGSLISAKQVEPNFWIAAGLKSIEKDEDDVPYFNIPNSEQFATLFEEIFELHYDTGLWMVSTETNLSDRNYLDMFEADRVLFADCTFYDVNILRSMSTDFGVIPYPKYDESQTEYYSRVEGCELFCIPTTNKTPEFAGVVLEALASESSKSVIPAYYDISLQTKIARDDESAEMLDIIFETRAFDWGDTILSSSIRDKELRDLFETNNRNLASTVAAMQTRVDTKLTSIIETFEKIK